MTDAKRQVCISRHDVSGFQTNAEGDEIAIIGACGLFPDECLKTAVMSQSGLYGLSSDRCHR